ncbi:putative CWC16 protein [Lupinus albus]|uniref:Splicing factor YJU2 n=1 Tax=Lupinus albus TaxID=3870 RepID=A0A6A4NEL2_LUPAL|nr:putative CWC16 protein [Lupinus albus]
MGERKVLNKYYPPDFDPAKLPRARRPKNQQIKVRMMLPMSIRCNTCGNYIYKGTKFNSRKEDVIGETYLGIQIFRFYFKCTKCSAELTMKTDPQNSDYIVESGASRNYEPWRAEDEETDKMKQKREAEELGDAMKSLENRTLDSKREMDILAALDEMKSMKSRHATVTVDEMLEALQRTAADKEKRLEEEDEKLIKSVVFHNSNAFVKRVRDEDIENEEQIDQLSNATGETSNNNLKRQKNSEDLPGNANDALRKASLDDSAKQENSRGGGGKLNPLVRISVIKKPTTSDVKSPAEPEQRKNEEDDKTNTSSGLLSLCQNYESNEDED